ncbi:hypothetical protein TTHERM_00647339 (macronuclear) [Tetrahymena thermophila SB210]|uniref:Uncharacterized protein n=1 Tax=Tetrahymena thermophila (strain SB210) TaxID=312017 RepID=A4VCP7_TETTS|nr:hypothetical protein TTHERM_00647339 [Tetrahymena thermophila SB210]EDK31306.1 hypothetical protein TTHERM_00647339 [Tetrahymena thermophila SB210]6Z1P_BS Chain BS, mS87 [Tetrahymena thermophila SB210]|eukprot:XP_001471063.1 hypothetical protein TTHERM_00647339 [Tetrahymena thermophila SB210]
MIRSILKQVKGNLTKGNSFNAKLNEIPVRCFSSSTGEGNEGDAPKNQQEQQQQKDQQPQQQQQPLQNQGKNQKQFDNKRNFQNNQQGANADRNADKQKKNFTPFKQQSNNQNYRKREDGESDQQNQGGFRSNSQNQQNSTGFTSSQNQRNQPKKEVLSFNLKKAEDQSNRDSSNQQDNKQRPQRPQRENQNDQASEQSEGQSYQKSSTSSYGSEGMFLNQLFKSEQNKTEKQKGANQHQQLMKRIKSYEQNGNPSEQEMRMAIECYNSCGLYDKTIATFQTYKDNFVKGKQGVSLNETILNSVFESYLKNSSSKFNDVNEFFLIHFAQTKQLKLIYKDNIQNYISRVCIDPYLNLSQRIEFLSEFVNMFTNSQDADSLVTSSFNNIDLSSLSSLFGNADTQQYIQASKTLATLMNLSIQHNKGSFNQLGKNTEFNKVQFEIINTKKIFNNLLNLKQYEICREIVEALSRGNLLHSHTFTSKSSEQQKYIDYKDLIKFSLDFQVSVNYWIDVIAKKVDFESFTQLFSSAILELRMNQNPPKVFSIEQVYDFFYNISNYGALNPTQVYILMDISIYLKEYNLAIELFTHHQKYTNRRRDNFVYEKMIQVVNSINLRQQAGKSNKDHVLQAYRKLYTEAEQQTGKPIGFLNSKIYEIKSCILDQNHDSAYSIFNDRFLKESIANYQALKMKYFLLLLLEKQDERDLQYSEISINKFINGLAPKQLIQIWNDDRNDTYLAKQLANKENDYNEFVKRIEVEKYYSIIKRDINNGFYTIEDRRQNMDVMMNEYERYVIDNFEVLDPEYTLDGKLKGAVLDGILKIRKYEEVHLKKEERRKEKQSKKGEKESDSQTSQALIQHQKEMEDTQIEINKILGRPIDTPVNVPELYKKYDTEDKMNNKYIERYVKNLQQNEFNKEGRLYKMKFMNLDQYKEASQCYPELVEQAEILARPQIPSDVNLVFELMTWGAENQQPLAIQLGEIYCDLNGIPVPSSLVEKINKAIDPYNDNLDFINQITSAKRLIGDINRERVYQTYTHFSQKPKFAEQVNQLGEEDKYRDEATYVLQQEQAASRLTKYGIPKKYIMEQLKA